MPTWLKIAVVTKRDEVTRVCEMFDALDAQSVNIESADHSQDSDEFQPSAPRWPVQIVSGLFDEKCDSESVVATMRHFLGSSSAITSSKLPDCDWVAFSQKATQPIEISDNLWICPEWDTPPSNDGRVIWITPGIAFGTGHHPSTALCIEKLATLDLEDTVVLDWGCGSGILAVVALALGATRALAVDIDHHALAATCDNAAKNNVNDRLEISRPEGVPGDFRCQLIVANLLESTLIKLAKTFEHHIVDKGKLLLSGVLEEQAANVILAFGPRYSFESFSRDGWTMITAQYEQAS